MSKRPGTNADRDVYVRKDSPIKGTPVYVEPDEEHTGVHNASLKALDEIRKLDQKLEANKVEAARAHGALKTEVLGLKTTVDKMDDKLDRLAESNARLEGRVEERGRSRSSSSQQRAVVEDTLAKRILARGEARWKGIVTIAAALLGGGGGLWLLQHLFGGR